MSKYQPLTDHLASLAGDVWRASFAELEAVLGFPLPKAARSSEAWWDNAVDRPHGRAWFAHGWEAQADRRGEAVVFRRIAAAPAPGDGPRASMAKAVGMTAVVGGVAAALGVAFSLLRRRRKT